ncbi:hypothetical protein Skr01_43850 [Sphaerisporangium krabiense]|uniref:Uncharacterized protein n=1 Tax=Sphaerisporangium krabiense TaxID=763782 RepID=A0A7W9DNB0_9ACTN|nr:hypothetical protein [Sphaerisporangium krabiense]MBB5625192.1 hypothetical protein [Sphaerisporangium krabiense]GII64300.1 hypothetical protein Skr01_43850 [Sphaerisporangium krabiense]
MKFTVNPIRRAAVGASLVIAALALPVTAHAATAPSSAPKASVTTAATSGPYWDLRQCSVAASASGGYCFLRNGRWYVYVP